MATKPTYRYRAPVPGRFRNVMSVFQTKDGRTIVRKWQRSGRPNPSPAELETRAQFKQAVQNIKNVAPEVQQFAREASAGTAWTWRDLLMAWQYGHNIEVTGPDGRVYIGLRDMAIEAQTVLDSIIDSVGAVLVRTPTGWKGLIPGPAGEVLTSTGPGAPPNYAPVSAGAGGVIAPAALVGWPSGIVSWNSTTSAGANFMRLKPIYLTSGQKVTGVVVPALAASASAHMTPVLYRHTSGVPAALMAKGPTVVGAISGGNKLPFDTAFTAVNEEICWLGWIHTGAAITLCNLSNTGLAYLSTSSDTVSDPCPTMTLSGTAVAAWWGY